MHVGRYSLILHWNMSFFFFIAPSTGVVSSVVLKNVWTFTQTAALISFLNLGEDSDVTGLDSLQGIDGNTGEKERTNKCSFQIRAKEYNAVVH